MKTAVQLGIALTLAAGATHADTLALVAADSLVAETNVQTAMLATGKFTAVDIIDTQNSTPTIDMLTPYTDVLVWTSAAPADRVALGDVLALYYAKGGKHVTIANYSFSHIDPVPPFNLPNPELQGGIMSQQNAALTNVGTNGDVSGTLVETVPGDPIFTGLTASNVFYFENQYFAHPGLAAGATLLAADGTGSGAVNLIARSQSGVVKVNVYPAGMAGNQLGSNSDSLYLLLANSFIPVPSASAPPAPPSANPGGPYSFCPAAAPWVLDGSQSVDPEAGKSDPGQPADQITAYDWDLSGKGTFSDATGVKPDVTTFFTNLGPGTYPIALRVTASTAASFPSSGRANLTGTASTTVKVDTGCACITALTAAATAHGQIQLTWPQTTSDHFDVYRSTNSGSGYALLGSVPGSATGYLDGSVAPGVTYYYVVREATATNAEICTSNEASADPPVNPLTDTMAPTTTADVDPDPNARGWNHTPVAVIFRASDHGGIGVKTITITWTGADTGNRSAAGRIAWIHLGTEGTTTVTYFATDQAGNSETPKTLTVMIDRTKPTAAATLSPAPDANGISHSDVTVTFTGADSLSGIRSCTGSVTLRAGGPHTARGVCRDNAGNASEPAIATAKFDTGSPVIAGVPHKCVLWPPNSQMVTVATLTAHNATTFNVTGASNEAPDPGNTDIAISGSGLDPRVIQLRAERLATGTGRVYTLTATASNATGDTTAQTFTCTVPLTWGAGSDNKPDGDHDDAGNSAATLSGSWRR